MSKRKIVDEELDLGDLEEAPPSATRVADTGNGGMTPPCLAPALPQFEMGKWNGIEQFKCAHCAFDTLIKDEMIEHLFWVHSIMIEEKEK